MFTICCFELLHRYLYFQKHFTPEYILLAKVIANTPTPNGPKLPLTLPNFPDIVNLGSSFKKIIDLFF